MHDYVAKRLSYFMHHYAAKKKCFLCTKGMYLANCFMQHSVAKDLSIYALQCSKRVFHFMHHYVKKKKALSNVPQRCMMTFFMQHYVA